MKFIASFSTLLLIYFFSISCVNGADRESANELYVKSGLEKQMQDIGPALLAGYKNNYGKSKHHTAHDEKIYSNIGQVIESSFAIQAMRETVVTGLMKDMAKRDMKLILAWLDSPVGKKITGLEERAGSKEGMEATREYIRNIKKASVSAERVYLIKDLNSSMNITETTVDITLSTQFALSMTLRKVKKKLSCDDIRRLYEDFKKNGSRIEAMVEPQVHGSLLSIYRTLSDEELGEYVAFTKSESGRRYTSVTSSFLLQAIIESSLQFVWGISQL